MNFEELVESMKEISKIEGIDLNDMRIREGKFGGIEILTYINGYEQLIVAF